MTTNVSAICFYSVNVAYSRLNVHCHSVSHVPWHTLWHVRQVRYDIRRTTFNIRNDDTIKKFIYLLASIHRKYPSPSRTRPDIIKRHSNSTSGMSKMDEKRAKTSQWRKNSLRFAWKSSPIFPKFRQKHTSPESPRTKSLKSRCNSISVMAKMDDKRAQTSRGVIQWKKKLLRVLHKKLRQVS